MLPIWGKSEQDADGGTGPQVREVEVTVADYHRRGARASPHRGQAHLFGDPDRSCLEVQYAEDAAQIFGHVKKTPLAVARIETQTVEAPHGKRAFEIGDEDRCRSAAGQIHAHDVAGVGFRGEESFLILPKGQPAR